MKVGIVLDGQQILVLVAVKVEDEVEDGAHYVAGYPKVGAVNQTNFENNQSRTDWGE